MATGSGGAQELYGSGDGGRAPVVRIGPRRPPWRVAVGSVLRDWRSDQGLRLADVAERARVSVQYLSEVERGRKEPSSEVLAAVTEALGGSLAELALGVARQLTPAEGRRRVGTGMPARIAHVRELHAITSQQAASGADVSDSSHHSGAVLLAA